MTAVVRLDVTVRREEIDRLLGCGRRTSAASSRTARRLGELEVLAHSLLEPRGVWRRISAAEASAVGLLAGDRPAAIGLCTIGPGLEEEAGRRAAAGELFDALLLDAYASVAAEEAADALQRRICEAVAPASQRPGPRRSPGYPGWELRQQRELLALLPAAELGIHLTPGTMMVPRKSVSFGMPLLEIPADAGGVGETGPDRCDACAAECPYRRVEPDEPAHGPRPHEVEAEEE